MGNTDNCLAMDNSPRFQNTLIMKSKSFLFIRIDLIDLPNLRELNLSQENFIYFGIGVFEGTMVLFLHLYF